MLGRAAAVFALTFLVDLVPGQELVLKPPKEVFSAPVGSSMVISCFISDVDGEASSSYKLHWIDHNNLEVTTKTGRVYIEDEGQGLKKLYVTSIKETDAGLYQCRSRIAGNWKQKPIQLIVFKDITFDDAPFVQTPAINTNALILCKVSGIPMPLVSWRRDNTKFHYGEKFIKEADGLRINEITESDNGNYTCRAEVETDGRYSERKIEVIVHIPPKITYGLTVKEGVEGTDLAMSCKASGLPSPLYEFFKDNQTEPVASSDRIHIENLTGNIYFSPLVKLDEGRYTCRVSNGAGNDTTVGELRVLVPPSIETLKEVWVSEGETAIIECRSFGDPLPDMTFQWADHHTLQKDSNRVIVTNPAGGYLVVSVSNVEPSDAGNFSCQARSSVGSDERTGTLKVLYQPRFFDNQSSVEYIWAGKRQNMSCGVSAVPEPKIEWLRGGFPITNNDTYHVYDLGGISFLQIQVREIDQGWIYGPYVCRATNRLGEVDKSIDLIRASIPDAPASVELVEVYPTAVFLRAVPPEENGGMNVYGYRVEYEDRVNDFSLDDDIIVDSLKPSTTYIFKVRARNEVGIGLGFDRKVATAAIRQPYPTEITSEPVGKDAYEYIITWKAPINSGLPILSYKFSYRKVLVERGSFNISQPLEDWIIEPTDEDIPLNYYQLRDLQPESHYELEIRTQNSMGWSQSNKQFVFLTAKDLFATTSTSTIATTTLTLTSSSSSSQPPQNASLSLSDTFTASAVVPETAVDDVRPRPNIVGTTTPAGTDTGETGSMHAADVTVPVVVVVIIICLLFLAIVDISCYFMNSCGLTMFICVHICGREPRKYRPKGIEEGERSVIRCCADKKPLSDDALQQMEPLATSHSGDSDYKALAQSHRSDERIGSAPDARVRLKNLSETDGTEC